MKRLLSSFIVLISAIIAQADLTQNANLSITAGGTNTLPGTGIDFTNYVWTGDGTPLNMGGYAISNTVDTNGFALDLNTAAITNGGVLLTCRSGTNTSGSIILTNLTSAVLSNVTTYSTATSDGVRTGEVDIKGTDSSASGNTLALNYIDTGTGPGTVSGSIDLQGFYGINVSGQNTPRANVYGYAPAGLYTLVTSGHASGAGTVRIGTAGAPIGAGGVTIPYGITTRAFDDQGTYDSHRAGGIYIYTLGPVSVGDLNTEGNYGTNSGTNNVTVVNSGNASVGRIITRTSAGYNEPSGSNTFTGGGSTTGTLTITSIDASAGGVSGPVILRNYLRLSIPGAVTNGAFVAGIMGKSGRKLGSTTVTNIGTGGVSIPYGWCAVMSGDGDSPCDSLTISTLGSVLLGNLDNRWLGSNAASGGRMDITSGSNMTVGAIFGMQKTTSSAITLAGGGTTSGGLTGTAVNVGSGGGSGGTISISNFTGVAISGSTVWTAGVTYASSLITAADPASGTYNGGAITITNIGAEGVTVASGIDARTRTAGSGGSVTISSVGSIDIVGDVRLDSTTAANNGILSLSSTGGAISLGSLDVGRVKQAKLDCGTMCTVTGVLSGVNTNYTLGSGTLIDPYVVTQQVLRTVSGKLMYYDSGIIGNSYLGGFAYRLPNLSGTTNSGGILLAMPIAATPSNLKIPTSINSIHGQNVFWP